MNKEDAPLFEEAASKMIGFLAQKAPGFRCSACHKKDFSIPPGFYLHSMQENRNVFTLPGRSLEAITIVCNNCGMMFNFSTSIMNNETANGKQKK